MKWTEPWLESIKNQDSFNPFDRRVLKSCLVWTLAMLFIMLLTVLQRDDFLTLIFTRLWFAPVMGFALAWLLYFLTWVSPIKIDSGPRGIVRTKGSIILLLPWRLINSYALDSNYLELRFVDGSKTKLLLPTGIDLQAISEELDANIGKDDAKQP